MVIEKEISGILIGESQPVRLMGVLNLGIESFYKGSVVSTIGKAVKRAEQMVAEGADFLDLGAMSTAPGVNEISELEEKERLIPVLKGILEGVDIPISVDTFRSNVANEALMHGAEIINDVSGFVKDKNMVTVLKEYDAPSIIMATKEKIGDPLTISDTIKSLKKSINYAESQKYDSTKIIVDPAIGRWVPEKTYHYNLDIIKNLQLLSEIERPILVGISRKSFIHEILNRPDPKDRLNATLSATAIAVLNGAHIVRTHDVRATYDVVRIAELLRIKH